MKSQAKSEAARAGALARAVALTAEQRSTIARKAALRKAGYPSATHFGEVIIAGAMIPCAVLDDGRRVVWQREVVGLLTGNKKGGLARYLQASNLQPYAPEKFKYTSFDESAIVFELNGSKAHGFEGEDIVDICKMYLSARNANSLLPAQIGLAARAEIIVLSLAKLGITALIDEATGFQEVRDRRALQALLDKYLLKEYASWAKRFPDSFYQELFRLRGWKYPTESGTRPGVVGYWTMDIVYSRLAPGLVEELKLCNPKGDNGRRKAKHHQWLSSDIGHPALSEHLHATIALMRANECWDAFMRQLNKALPIKSKQLAFNFD